MTKLQEFREEFKDGRIVEFKDGTLGIIISSTIICCDGGIDCEGFNDDLTEWRDKTDKRYIPKKIYTLRRDITYLADIMFWLCDKEFSGFFDEVIWKNKKKKD